MAPRNVVSELFTYASKRTLPRQGATCKRRARPVSTRIRLAALTRACSQGRASATALTPPEIAGSVVRRAASANHAHHSNSQCVLNVVQQVIGGVELQRSVQRPEYRHAVTYRGSESASSPAGASCNSTAFHCPMRTLRAPIAMKSWPTRWTSKIDLRITSLNDLTM